MFTSPALKVAANIILAMGVIVAVMLWGYAIWWLLMAISSVIETMTQGVPSNLGWWGSGEGCRLWIQPHLHVGLYTM